MTPTRRQILLQGLCGAGWLGLRALATGLPMGLLANPARAADRCEPAAGGRAQYLILSTSAAGDPLNANVPGTYEHADIMHPEDPAMVPVPLRLSGQPFLAAQPWSTLPQAVLDRTVFFHHATHNNNHGNQAKVMRLMGALQRQEMLVSMLARELAPCLGTVQREPVVLGASGPSEYLSANGRVLPALSPTGLRDVLTGPSGPLLRLQQLRDADLDRLSALYRRDGTPAQRAFLDRLALSQREARALSQSLLDSLSAINGNGPEGQVQAAVALIRMNVTPVVSLHIPFGGDNHNDADLQNEAAQHESGLATLRGLLRLLAERGLADRVTFAALNAFGRTLSINRKGRSGRDHHAGHHCAVLIGKGLRGGVIGALAPQSGDFSATPIDSTSGRGAAGGDISFQDTLGALGKTLGAAVGVAATALEEQISAGKVVKAALA